MEKWLNWNQSLPVKASLKCRYLCTCADTSSPGHCRGGGSASERGLCPSGPCKATPLTHVGRKPHTKPSFSR